ncbi:hypothetical protein D3C78_1040030 [compost metagenome]
MRLNAAKLGALDFEVARKHCSNNRYRHQLAGIDIFGAANNLQLLACSYINLTHIQLISVRVLFLRFHIADHNAGYALVAGFNDIDFNTAARHFLRKLFRRKAGEIDILA